MPTGPQISVFHSGVSGANRNLSEEEGTNGWAEVVEKTGLKQMYW
jgi:hypothetical protein